MSGRWVRNAPPGSAVWLTVGLTFDPAFYPKVTRSMRDEIVHKIEVLSNGRVTPSVEFVFGRYRGDSKFQKAGFMWQYE